MYIESDIRVVLRFDDRNAYVSVRHTLSYIRRVLRLDDARHSNSRWIKTLRSTLTGLPLSGSRFLTEATPIIAK